jgi:hypothetical protein
MTETWTARAKLPSFHVLARQEHFPPRGDAALAQSRVCRGVARHLHGTFERSAVLQVGGDAGRPEGVVADAA